MSGFAVAAYLFCYACALGYVLFGILQMLWPMKALPVYRFFLGRTTFERYEARLRGFGRGFWKMVGAFYICFGMLVVWVLMRSLQR